MDKRWSFTGSNTRRGQLSDDSMGSNNPGHPPIQPCPYCNETNLMTDEIVVCKKCGETYPRS